MSASAGRSRRGGCRGRHGAGRQRPCLLIDRALCSPCTNAQRLAPSIILHSLMLFCPLSPSVGPPACMPAASASKRSDGRCPWPCLPACLAALFLLLMHCQRLQARTDRKRKMSMKRTLASLSVPLCVPLCVLCGGSLQAAASMSKAAGRRQDSATCRAGSFPARMERCAKRHTLAEQGGQGARRALRAGQEHRRLEAG